MAFWDDRYSRSDYLFGEEPNAFLAREAHRIAAPADILCVADGEGRNGVFLAEHGHRVHSVDGSAVAVAKAERLAGRRGVEIAAEVADLETWTFPTEAYDAVVAIFIQFAPPPMRARLFHGMIAALRPGGLLIVEGYRPEQIAYATGGPSQVENLYTEALLADLAAGLEILHLAAYDAHLSEGAAHVGPSALIDLVARKPAS